MPADIVLSKSLGLKKTRVIGYELTAEGVLLDVKSAFDDGRCSGCFRRVRRVHDRYEGRTWRHLDFAGMKVSLRSTLRRLVCPRCGVRIELVPWADHGSAFTRRFEEQVAFLAQHANRTVVSELMQIAWRTVGLVIERVLARLGPRDLLGNLRRIGVDELSYRKHHEYVTVVIDHDTGRLVWGHPGKNADTLKLFFDQLGPERSAQLENVSMDMSQAYINAVREKAPNATIVFDRFHVQRLAQDALDELRRAEVREDVRPRAPRSRTAAGRFRRIRGTSAPSRARSSSRSRRPTSGSTAATCSRRPSRRSSTGASTTSPATSSSSGAAGPNARASSPSNAPARPSSTTSTVSSPTSKPASPTAASRA